jgi:hypothetical protein
VTSSTVIGLWILRPCALGQEVHRTRSRPSSSVRSRSHRSGPAVRLHPRGDVASYRSRPTREGDGASRRDQTISPTTAYMCISRRSSPTVTDIDAGWGIGGDRIARDVGHAGHRGASPPGRVLMGFGSEGCSSQRRSCTSCFATTGPRRGSWRRGASAAAVERCCCTWPWATRSPRTAGRSSCATSRDEVGGGPPPSPRSGRPDW